MAWYFVKHMDNVEYKSSVTVKVKSFLRLTLNSQPRH
jgi:hypothetical protein